MTHVSVRKREHDARLSPNAARSVAPLLSVSRLGPTRTPVSLDHALDRRQPYVQ